MAPSELLIDPVATAEVNAPPLPLQGESWDPIAEALLEKVQEPSLLLDRTGRIIGCNAGALDLISAAAGLMCHKGVLCTPLASTSRALGEAIAAVVAQNGVARSSRQLSLQRPDGGQLTLLLLRWTAGGTESTEPRALVIARSAGPAPSVDVVRFGFTPAEKRVAVALIEGLSLKAIAMRHNRSLNTIRTHLARLMAKTQTNRQSDLVLRLARSAANTDLPPS